MNTIETKMLADELTKYIKEKHTQEECVGFSDGFELALQLATNNDALGGVSDMFSFANYLEDKYTYFDNTEHGDTYTDNITGKEFTEGQIYCKWLRWK